MQFSLVAVVSAVAVQAVFVSGAPAAGKAGDKTIEQLNQEFIKAGTQLQTDLKNARANAAIKSDTHAQAVLDAVEGADKIVEQLEKNLIDPKHPLSEDQLEKLVNDLKVFVRKIKSELRQVKQENEQTVRHVLNDLATRGKLLKEIAEKQDSNVSKKIAGESLLLTF